LSKATAEKSEKWKSGATDLNGAERGGLKDEEALEIYSTY
jgi:hypothetical protein